MCRIEWWRGRSLIGKERGGGGEEPGGKWEVLFQSFCPYHGYVIRPEAGLIEESLSDSEIVEYAVIVSRIDDVIDVPLDVGSLQVDARDAATQRTAELSRTAARYSAQTRNQ